MPCEGESFIAIKCLEKWVTLMIDPIEVITHPECIIPKYEPIYGADDHEVAGYEVIGYFVTEEEETSLKSFFQDTTVPVEFMMEVERVITERALGELALRGGEWKVFIHKHPETLLADEDEWFLGQLLASGMDMKRFVIEIELSSAEGSMESLLHLCRYYKTYGIQWSIEHSMTYVSLKEYTAMLTPDILKVDLAPIRHMNNTLLIQDVYHSLAHFSRKIGASLLYYNMDTAYQLRYAWKHSGRYYQGSIFRQPERAVSVQDQVKTKLRNDIHAFITQEKTRLERIYARSELFNETIRTFLQRNPYTVPSDAWLLTLSTAVAPFAFRVYISDADGYQISSNITNRDQMWQVFAEYQGKNWSWRPYFLKTILSMQKDDRGQLSDLYCDISRGTLTRTFSYPLAADAYLFMDLSYDYLYENDLL
ncbi:MAG: EAL-associated domain-containing protein [Bacilli bacterium]